MVGGKKPLQFKAEERVLSRGGIAGRMNLQLRRDPTPSAASRIRFPPELPHHTVPSHCSEQSHIQPPLLIITITIVVRGEATFQHRRLKMRAEQQREEEDGGVGETGRAGRKKKYITRQAASPSDKFRLIFFFFSGRCWLFFPLNPCSPAVLSSPESS